MTQHTIAISDTDLAALLAVRSVIADSQHPAAATAIGVIDRLREQARRLADPRSLDQLADQAAVNLENGKSWRAAGCPDGEWPPPAASSQPLDVTQPDDVKSHQVVSRTAHVVPAGEDLHFALLRPDGSSVQRWALGVGADHDRRMTRLTISALSAPR